MTAPLLLSLAISTVLGVLVLRLLWPHDAMAWPRPLALSIGIGLGSGLSSALLFLWIVAFGPTRGFPVAEAGLLGLLAWAAGRRAHPASAPRAAAPRADHRLVARLLSIAGLGTFAAAAAAFGANLRRFPHGGWDAWMNWDMRARMIFRGGEGWRTAFSGALPWSHPDYPVLVPSLVVRGWLYAGHETLLGPALVAATFTFGTVALLLTALGTLRSLSQGLLAALVLLSTPFFILHGTSLYADVPLGFFFLATFVCLALDGRADAPAHRFAVLAGAAAGIAMWTKNEGLVFALSIAAGLLLQAWHGGWRPHRGRLLAFGTGLLPWLCLVVGFKIAFAPPNDLLSTLGIERTWGRLTAPDRYALVAREYASHILTFGRNGLTAAAWPLAACLLGLGLDPGEAGRSWARAAAAALVLLLAAHFVVFVSMADELARLLNSSLDRLLLQLWPSALFLLFMVLRTPEELTSAPPATAAPSGAEVSP